VSLLHQLDAALREALAEDRGRRRLLVRQNFLDLIAQALLELSDRRAVAAVFPRHRPLALAAFDDRQRHLAHQLIVCPRELMVRRGAQRQTRFVVMVDDFAVRVETSTGAVDVRHDERIGMRELALQ
jgi:hypothetical protein